MKRESTTESLDESAYDDTGSRGSAAYLVIIMEFEIMVNDG